MADMERGKKQEHIERLALEFLAYDDMAVGAATKCFLLGADPDKLTATALEAYNTILEFGALKTDY